MDDFVPHAVSMTQFFFLHAVLISGDRQPHKDTSSWRAVRLAPFYLRSYLPICPLLSFRPTVAYKLSIRNLPNNLQNPFAHLTAAARMLEKNSREWGGNYGSKDFLGA